MIVDNIENKMTNLLSRKQLAKLMVYYTQTDMEKVNKLRVHVLNTLSEHKIELKELPNLNTLNRNNTFSPYKVTVLDTVIVEMLRISDKVKPIVKYDMSSSNYRIFQKEVNEITQGLISKWC
jgi:hypothetical protein